jgi:hypothetical protein
MLSHQSLQAAQHLIVEAEGELGDELGLDGRHPQLLEPADVREGERVVGDVGQCRAAPELQRLVDREERPGRVLVAEGLPGLIKQPLETDVVHLLPVDGQPVAEPAPYEQLAVDPPPAARLELLTELVDVGVQHLDRAVGRRLSPDRPDEVRLGDLLVRLEQQHDQDRPLLGPPQLERASVDHDLKWPEHPELHLAHRQLTTIVGVQGRASTSTRAQRISLTGR